MIEAILFISPSLRKIKWAAIICLAISMIISIWQRFGQDKRIILWSWDLITIISLVLLLFRMSFMIQRQRLILRKNFGLLVETLYCLGTRSEVFFHGSEIRDCVVFEHLKPTRVIPALGLLLRDDSLFAAFKVFLADRLARP